MYIIQQKGRGVAAHSLENLLATNILQSRMQLLHSLRHLLELGFILALNFASLSNNNVGGELNGVRTRQPPAGLSPLRVNGEAELVLARVGSSESVFARVATLLVDDAMVIIEGLHDSQGGDEVRVRAIDV